MQMMGPVYLLVFVLALAGNVCNAAIYQSSCFRSSIAVRMLTFKAVRAVGRRRGVPQVANTLFIACHLPKALSHVCPTAHALHMWAARTRPSALFVSNTCGTVAIWVTVLIVLERYVAVVHPNRHRTMWCAPPSRSSSVPPACSDRRSTRRLFVVLGGMALVSAVLHSIHLVNRNIHVLECPAGGYLGAETEYHVVRIATRAFRPRHDDARSQISARGTRGSRCSTIGRTSCA